MSVKHPKIKVTGRPGELRKTENEVIKPDVSEFAGYLSKHELPTGKPASERSADVKSKRAQGEFTVVLQSLPGDPVYDESNPILDAPLPDNRHIPFKRPVLVRSELAWLVDLQARIRQIEADRDNSKDLEVPADLWDIPTGGKLDRWGLGKPMAYTASGQSGLGRGDNGIRKECMPEIVVERPEIGVIVPERIAELGEEAVGAYVKNIEKMRKVVK